MTHSQKRRGTCHLLLPMYRYPLLYCFARVINFNTYIYPVPICYAVTQGVPVGCPRIWPLTPIMTFNWPFVLWGVKITPKKFQNFPVGGSNIHRFDSCSAQMFSGTRTCSRTIGQLKAWTQKSCVFWVDTLRVPGYPFVVLLIVLKKPLLPGQDTRHGFPAWISDHHEKQTAFHMHLTELLRRKHLIRFCDPLHNGYLEFGDPPIKGYWNLVIPPTDLLGPPCRS